MYRKKGRGWTKHIDFMLIDIACIVIAFFISYVIRFGFNNPYVDKDYRILGVAFLLIDFFVEIMADSFKNVLKRGYLDEFISTCKHAVLVFLVTALFLFTTQMADIYSRLSFYIMFPIYVTITYVARLALKSFLKKKGFGASRKSLFVIAPDAMLRDTLCTVEKSCIGYTKIVAASLDTDMKGMTICGIPIVANHDGIVDYACDEWVDEVLIPPCSEDEYPERMADIFLEMGIAVHTGITKNGTAQGGYKQIEKIGDYTVVTSSVNYANTSALLVKRGMDIVGGLVGCLFTLIIMIFVGPMIYIASPGPIFFAQERVGRNGRKFKMYKFRSMYMDAEERKKELAAQNKVGDGMMFKMDFDPRIIGNKVLPNGKKNNRTVNKMNNKRFEIGAGEQPLDIIKETCGFAGIFKQIGVIGDSLASGEFESHDENGNIVYTDMYEYSWPAVLERITGTKYNNYSRGGMTAREYVQSWADENGFWQWNQAYIIALGNNDSFVFGHPLGSVKDVNADCPQDNGDTFFGNMGKIVSKLKTIEPNARIFVVTPQLRGEACDNDIRYIASELAKFCDMFEFTYLLDMTAHAPVYDAEMRKSFGLGFHPNPMGYYAYALIVGNYIDYIIRSNPQEFATIPFVGTLLKNKDYK